MVCGVWGVCGVVCGRDAWGLDKELLAMMAAQHFDQASRWVRGVGKLGCEPRVRVHDYT